MKTKHLRFILSFAVALICCVTFGPLKAKAEETNLVGLSSDLIRLYISPSNQLEVIDDSFFFAQGEENKTESCTIDGVSQLVSQFTFNNCSTGAYVNVRSGPSLDAEVIGRIYSGCIATAVGSSGEWTKIISGNIEGYVFTEYFKFGQEALDTAEQYYSDHYRVISDTLNLRAEPNTNSTIKAKLCEFAELVKIGDVEGKPDWIKVKWIGTASTVVGYVSTEYISNNYAYAVTLERAKNFQNANTTQLANIIWPFPYAPGNGAYDIFNDFGYRNIGFVGHADYHQALDIGGAAGSPLVASLSGRVVSAGWTDSGGNYVTIDNGCGVQLTYCHCSKLLVTTGQYVTQGETVALCGMTGHASGPHLHFSIAINGSYVDPMDYLASYEWCLTWHCPRN